MIQKSFLLLLAAATEAFVVSPRAPKKVAFLKARGGRTSNDNVLARLEEEYRDLQNVLLNLSELSAEKKWLPVDTTRSIEGKTEEIAETMLETALDISAVKRYQQMEIAAKANKEMYQAEDDRRRSHALKEQARKEAMSAEFEAAMVEEFGAAYEDMERLRDKAVAHADGSIESDFELREFESEFLELEAGDRKKQAELLLRKLQENEAKLKQSLDELRELKSKKFMEGWHKNESVKHRAFLDKVKEAMPCIILDFDQNHPALY